MTNDLTNRPEGFNNIDWKLYQENENHVRYLKLCLKFVYLVHRFQQMRGEAFFGQEWIAKKLGISVRHVQNIIDELKKANVLIVKRRNRNYYRLEEFFSKPRQKRTDVAIGQTKGNNKINNLKS